MRTTAQEAARVDEDDPQKAAVYAWETAWKPWNYSTLALPECRWWVEEACKRFDVAPPRVRQHRTKEYPWCHVKLRVISFSPAGRNAPTALHEAAHQIAWDYFGDSIQDHGRTFIGIYLWLLEWSGVAPRIALRATARSHKLKWRTMSPDVCKGS